MIQNLTSITHLAILNNAVGCYEWRAALLMFCHKVLHMENG